MPFCQHELCSLCKGLENGKDKSKQVKLVILRKIMLKQIAHAVFYGECKKLWLTDASAVTSERPSSGGVTRVRYTSQGI